MMRNNSRPINGFTRENPHFASLRTRVYAINLCPMQLIRLTKYINLSCKIAPEAAVHFVKDEKNRRSREIVSLISIVLWQCITHNRFTLVFILHLYVSLYVYLYKKCNHVHGDVSDGS